MLFFYVLLLLIYIRGCNYCSDWGVNDNGGMVGRWSFERRKSFHSSIFEGDLEGGLCEYKFVYEWISFRLNYLFFEVSFLAQCTSLLYNKNVLFFERFTGAFWTKTLFLFFNEKLYSLPQLLPFEKIQCTKGVNSRGFFYLFAQCTFLVDDEAPISCRALTNKYFKSRVRWAPFTEGKKKREWERVRCQEGEDIDQTDGIQKQFCESQGQWRRLWLYSRHLKSHFNAEIARVFFFYH